MDKKKALLFTKKNIYMYMVHQIYSSKKMIRTEKNFSLAYFYAFPLSIPSKATDQEKKCDDSFYKQTVQKITETPCIYKKKTRKFSDFSL